MCYSDQISQQQQPQIEGDMKDGLQVADADKRYAAVGSAPREESQ